MSDHRQIIDGYKRKLEEVMRKSAEELTVRVISASPVDTGAFRASWTAGIGEVRLRTVNTGDRDSIDKAIGVINKMGLGDELYIANGQPYAQRLEYEGWSAQAPGGMMRVNIADWQNIVDSNL